MNYIGSKYSLLEFLDKSIHSVIDKDSVVFCDLFAGTGVVGAHFKKKGYKVISSDLQYYSYVINKYYIENNAILEFKNLVEELPELESLTPSNRVLFVCLYLTELDGVEGFIYNNYCPSGTTKETIPRMYYTDFNGKLCDAIRIQIEAWNNKGFLLESEYYFLLLTLLENIDKLANTTSTYGAFLKHIKKSAQGSLRMIPVKSIINNRQNEVYQKDCNTLITEIEGDILYLDPPYNNRQYACYYHVLETIAKYDSPTIKGVTGMRDYKTQRSKYCIKKDVLKEFTYLIENAKMKYIFMSYNNEGLLSHDEIRDVMSKRGEYGFFTYKYNRYKSDKTVNRNHKADSTIEYLHYVKVE